MDIHKYVYDMHINNERDIIYIYTYNDVYNVYVHVHYTIISATFFMDVSILWKLPSEHVIIDAFERYNDSEVSPMVSQLPGFLPHYPPRVPRSLMEKKHLRVMIAPLNKELL